MAQYINKDAVVAEIERLQDSIKATAIDDRISKEQAEAYKVCVKLRSFVEDTLEVKEVDLEKEYDNEFFKDPVLGKLVNRNAGISIAKHFFELGFNARK